VVDFKLYLLQALPNFN